MHELSILLIIWCCVFMSSWLAKLTHLTAVLWYLFCGALLVNTGLLPEQMPEFIAGFSELGIIIIMFALGFEENTRTFIKSVKRSWGIAFFGALAPFSIAYSAALFFWHDNNMALLCGLAMMATAVSLTMVSLKSEGLHQTPAATGIMTSAVLDDIASLALVAIMVPLAVGGGSVSIESILLIAAKVVAFFLVITILGAWVFPISKGWHRNIPIVGQFNLRSFLSMGQGDYIILSLLTIALSIGLLAHTFGFHPAVGAYMGGLIIQKEYFSAENEDQQAYLRARDIIDNMAFSWIGPVFFVVLGTKLIYQHETFVSIIGLSALLFLALFVGQILSASLAARFTGNFDWPASWMIGFGMLGRAELAFVVLDIAYVQHGIMNTEAFYTLMLTAFMLNLSVPITIRWWKWYFGSN